MAELLHITERSSWEAARAAGTYEMSTRGRTLEEVGFIHCSLRHQLPQVAEMLYSDTDPSALVVLVIDSERLTAPVRFEPPEPALPNAGGEDGEGARGGGAAEEFPHIYGPLPVPAVVAEEPWHGNSPTV
ncbi:DUF952 domain-containing protein [Streptomyces sp. WMMB 322]|uniref:DUF952 domain-containing protein n=1 Tax=Streptomyces sp. WMMB 322 TaxID=1286821 RepID=UPI0006E32C03|nr:DUF952 domain-containing protein [Streptomyces sp. WMMB 322]SCK22545.1 Uncharacterized conserved protein, DUF952 family [Streptomyces sp. WMMB 322]